MSPVDAQGRRRMSSTFWVLTIGFAAFVVAAPLFRPGAQMFVGKSILEEGVYEFERQTDDVRLLGERFRAIRDGFEELRERATATWLSKERTEQVDEREVRDDQDVVLAAIPSDLVRAGEKIVLVGKFPSLNNHTREAADCKLLCVFDFSAAIDDDTMRFLPNERWQSDPSDELSLKFVKLEVDGSIQLEEPIEWSSSDSTMAECRVPNILANKNASVLTAIVSVTLKCLDNPQPKNARVALSIATVSVSEDALEMPDSRLRYRSLDQNELARRTYPADGANHDACLCAVLPSGGPSVEWIEFHKGLGISRFMLYGNGFSTESHSVLSSYLHSLDVRLVNWPFSPQSFHDGLEDQAFAHCLETFGARPLMLKARKDGRFMINDAIRAFSLGLPRCEWIGFLGGFDFMFTKASESSRENALTSMLRRLDCRESSRTEDCYKKGVGRIHRIPFGHSNVLQIADGWRLMTFTNRAPFVESKTRAIVRRRIVRAFEFSNGTSHLVQPLVNDGLDPAKVSLPIGMVEAMKSLSSEELTRLGLIVHDYSIGSWSEFSRHWKEQKARCNGNMVFFDQIDEEIRSGRRQSWPTTVDFLKANATGLCTGEVFPYGTDSLEVTNLVNSSQITRHPLVVAMRKRLADLQPSEDPVSVSDLILTPAQR